MVVGLDIGTSFIRVVIAEIEDDGSIHIAGTSAVKSDGLKSGNIVNVEAAKNAIALAIENAEQNAGIEVSSVFTAVGGSQVSSTNSHGVVGVSKNRGTLREIKQEDIKRVIECAQTLKFPPDRQLLHVIPQNFIVDDVSTGTVAPIDRIGNRLEADVHIITTAETTVKTIQTCIDRARYVCRGVMLKTLASTYAVVHDDELELGSIVIDLGAGTTDVLVLFKGAPVYTTSIPVGGNLVTNDIVVVEGIPLATAEDIKMKYGCCWQEGIQNDEEVIIPGIGGRAPEVTSKTHICEIVQPRMEEIFTMVRSSVVKNSGLKQLAGNIILTGGGAQMEGVLELAEYVFKTSAVRIGIPEPLGGVEENYRRPDFATAIGLVIANKNADEINSGRRKKIGRESSKTAKKEGRMKKFLKAFF